MKRALTILLAAPVTAESLKLAIRRGSLLEVLSRRAAWLRLLEELDRPPWFGLEGVDWSELE